MDTIGSLIDKLSIVNIKIYFAENDKRKENASDKELAEATKKTNVLNSYRNALIEEIDVAIDTMMKSGKAPKVYGQLKDYKKS